MVRSMFRWAVVLLVAACAAWFVQAAEETAEPEKKPDCVYVPTPHDVTVKMLEMARLKKTDLVYDPGCGDGRLCVTAAKQYGCKAVGFEIVPELIEQAKKNVKRRNVESLVKIENQDIFKLDYSKATVLTIYLLPHMIERLIPSFEKMAPGSRIVAHDYHLPGIVADKSIEMTSKEDNSKHYLYFYQLPLKRSAELAPEASQ
jgi:precorrin-6B methylase 2